MSVDATDAELFASATAEEPQATPAEPTAAADTPTAPLDEGNAEGGDQPRDPKTGQFAAKSSPEPVTVPETTGQQAPKPADEPRPENRIPLAEHLKEREERQAAQRRAEEAERRAAEIERQLAEMSRPKPEPQSAPEMWVDPQGFLRHGVDQAVQPIQQQMEAMRDQFSRMLAVQQFGAEVVNEARREFDVEVRKNPLLAFEAQRMSRSEHPYAELVAWHRNRKALAEIGGDPAAYKTKLLSDALNDPEHVKRVLEHVRQQNGGQQQAPNGNGQARPRTITQLPPSLTRVTSAQAQSVPEDAAAPGDAELFAFATRG